MIAAQFLLTLTLCLSRAVASPMPILVLPAAASVYAPLPASTANTPSRVNINLVADSSFSASASASATTPSTIPQVLAANASLVNATLVAAATAVHDQATSLLGYVNVVTSILSLISTKFVDNFVPMDTASRAVSVSTTMSTGPKWLKKLMPSGRRSKEVPPLPVSLPSSESPVRNASFNDDSSSWSGFDALENLFIFGASYSATGFAANLPPPKPIDRKTAPFKGLTYYTDPDGTNWDGSSKLIWDPTNSLSVITWAGINDCAYARTHDETLDLLFSLQEKLYEAGGRQFLFMDVSPIARRPAGTKAKPNNPEADSAASIANWNENLSKHVTEFAASRPDARILTFSTLNAFNQILDDPQRYKIKAKEVAVAMGDV
ncbi:Glycosyltransferase family 32 protein [Mycena chlorophos]|uniref:Glycosyltransferase family 32 protein n=1 Tax=Mycena chlorophos TaxID=658473 RepID=A0A8H6VWF5_MYCCL|nr:Glycosyltransferase family 32 protein [Mycena chlorophos]